IVNDILRREAEDPEHPGIVVDTPERRAVADIAERLSFAHTERLVLGLFGFVVPKSREDILDRFSDDAFWMGRAGEYRRCVWLYGDLLAQSQREGRIADAAAYSAALAQCHNALGSSADARAAYDRAVMLAGRLTGTPYQALWELGATDDLQLVADERWEDRIPEGGPFFPPLPIEHNWLLAVFRATLARIYARLGRAEEALLLLGLVVPPLERAPGWAANYSLLACSAATVLWLLQRT